MHFLTLLPLLALTRATISIEDPSDTVNPSEWAADNAVLANYNVKSIMYQFIPIVGPYTYRTVGVTVSHQTRYQCGCNVADGSIARLSDVNITTHNGAANLYAFGTGSVAYVNNAWLYSSGPVSHGLYAGGNGTVYGSNVQVYRGGNRCSGFSGENPAGYIHINNAVVHTDGIGSAVCYALGLCNMTNVIGHASRSPVMFADGSQTGIRQKRLIKPFGKYLGLSMHSTARMP